MENRCGIFLLLFVAASCQKNIPVNHIAEAPSSLPGWRFSGAVRLSGGGPISDLNVYLIGNNNPVASYRSDSNGFFRFTSRAGMKADTVFFIRIQSPEFRSFISQSLAFREKKDYHLEIELHPVDALTICPDSDTAYFICVRDNGMENLFSAGIQATDENFLYSPRGLTFSASDPSGNRFFIHIDGMTAGKYTSFGGLPGRKNSVIVSAFLENGRVAYQAGSGRAGTTAEIVLEKKNGLFRGSFVANAGALPTRMAPADDRKVWEGVFSLPVMQPAKY